jgi:hypothetical protein
LKFITIIFIFSGFVSQTFSKAFIFTDYVLNKVSITNKYCENKDKPKLKCNGKCHLKKQLKEQEKQEAPTKNIDKGTNEVQFCSTYDANLLPHYTFIINSHNWLYLSGEATISPISVFHPPTV